MKKRVVIVTFVLVGILFLSIGFVSASAFTDFLKDLFRGSDSNLKGELATLSGGSVYSEVPISISDHSLYNRRSEGLRCEEANQSSELRALNLSGKICVSSLVLEYRRNGYNTGIFVHLMDVSEGLDIYKTYLSKVSYAGQDNLSEGIHRLESHELYWYPSIGDYEIVLTQEYSYTSDSTGTSYHYGWATGSDPVTAWFIENSLTATIPSTCTEKCVETDCVGNPCEGINYDVKGTVFSCYSGKETTGEDVCSYDGKTLKEFYCSGSEMNSIEHNCPNGCENGACLVETCTDTDGGKNIFEKGETSGLDWANNNTVTKVDYCILEGEKAGRLNEFYCYGDLGGRVRSETIGPEEGCTSCLDGACVKGTCQDMISKVSNPSNFITDGIFYELIWNSTQKYRRYIKSQEYSVTNYYASWNANYENQYFNIAYNLDIFDDESVNLSGWLEERVGYSVCKAQSYWSTDSQENKIYICNWDVLGNNQNLDNYQYKAREVLWTRGNIIVEIYLYSGKYLTDEEIIKLGEKKVSDFLNDLQNNQAKYVGWEYLGLDWPLSRQIEIDLAGCPSQIPPGTCEACWNCKLEPVICPAHGFQKKTCIDSCCNGNREEQVYCSPGICSGCIIPRWFQSSENVCMPYGFRFDHAVSMHKELKEYTEAERLEESSETKDYSLVIESNEKAVLTLYDRNGVGYNYDLIPGGSIQVEMPDWAADIQKLVIKTNEIHAAAYEGDKGYVDMEITIAGFENVIDTIDAYCHFDGEIKLQKINEEKCQNSYECKSNICTNGKCYGLAETLEGQMELLRQQTALLEEQNGLLKRIWCKLTTMFGKNPTMRYAQCLAEGTNATIAVPATTSNINR